MRVNLPLTSIYINMYMIPGSARTPVARAVRMMPASIALSCPLGGCPIPVLPAGVLRLALVEGPGPLRTVLSFGGTIA